MKPSRYVLLSALLAASAVSANHHEVRGRPDHLARRAPQPTPIGPFFGFGSSDSDSATRGSTSDGGLFPSASLSSSASAAAASSSSSAAAAASSSSAALASASASRAAAESSSIAAAAASSAAASVSSANAAESSAEASRSSAAAAASASRASVSAAAAASSASLTTSVGLTTTLTATVQATPTTVQTTSSPVNESSSGSGGASTGLIIGVSVAGGVLVLAAFIFLYFKFGTRRFSNFEDGDADIKWPELKHDPDSNVMQPLPARRTGGAGFDMGDESDGEGHDLDGNGSGNAPAGGMMGEKGGRDSFSGSTTALTSAPPVGYGVSDYSPGLDHGYGMDPAAGYYQDHHMYGGAGGGAAAHQYGMQTSPGGAYSDNGNPYSVDPYAHAGMVHPQQGQYSHGHYQ